MRHPFIVLAPHKRGFISFHTPDAIGKHSHLGKAWEILGEGVAGRTRNGSFYWPLLFIGRYYLFYCVRTWPWQKVWDESELLETQQPKARSITLHKLLEELCYAWKKKCEETENTILGETSSPLSLSSVNFLQWALPSAIR